MSATASVNQANSQHSTGPKTGEGKQISSLNALRHGLTGRHATLPSEDIGAYKQDLKSFQDHLQPQGPIEADLVHSLADTAWRLNRVAALETKILKSPESLETQIKALSNMSLYTQRLTRQFEKVERHLRELQQLRRLAEKTDTSSNHQKPRDTEPMASFFQTPDSTPSAAAAAPPSGPWPPAPTAS
jgi:hypothetical protein